MKAINKIWVFALGTAEVMVSLLRPRYVPRGGIVTEDQKRRSWRTTPNVCRRISTLCLRSSRSSCPTGPEVAPRLSTTTSAILPVCIATDGNGADMVSDNNGDYEWFSVAFQYSDRNANICRAHVHLEFLLQAEQAGQRHPVHDPRGYRKPDAYLLPRPGSGGACVRQLHAGAAFPVHLQRATRDKPTVPIVTWDMPAERAGANPVPLMPRSTKLIYDDLTQAIADLEGFQRTSKAAADRNVAYGMRARVNLVMNNWGEAATDAEAALSGYTFLSRMTCRLPVSTVPTPRRGSGPASTRLPTPPPTTAISPGADTSAPFARGYTTSQGFV